MFVAEKAGRVRVVTAAGTLLATPLIDISGHVHPSGDRGLLGIAVDTSFASNRYLYLLYTYDASSSHPTGPKTSRLTRVTVNTNNTASSETVLVGSSGPRRARRRPTRSIASPPTAARIRSAPSVRRPTARLGGSGDGSDYGGVDERSLRAQDEQSFAGKLIHVDRNGRGLPGHPFCPAETDLTQVCTKVWAKGFRNPFRFTLRPTACRPSVTSAGARRRRSTSPSPGATTAGPVTRAGRAGGYSGFSTCSELYSKQGTSAGVPSPTTSTSIGHRRRGHRRADLHRRPVPGRVRRRHLVRRLRARVHQAHGVRFRRAARRHQGLRDRLVRRRPRAAERRAVLRRLRRRRRGQGSVRRIVYSPNNSSPSPSRTRRRPRARRR